MPHITSIGAGMFSDLSICIDTSEINIAKAAPTKTNLEACFATALLPTVATGTASAGEFVSIKNVREFPAMGTPPNVVNVPVYGQATSQQIQGQADAPSIEIQVNYIASEWAAGTILGNAVGDGNQYLFRFTLLNAKPDGLTAAALASTENTSYYWVGKMEAIQVSPQLTDANTATITITVQSDFYGAFSAGV